MSPSHEKLWQLGLKSIEELETERGILASGRSEVYGCIFGRDSLITSLKLLRAYEKTKSPYFLTLTKKILVNLAELQGKDFVLESGEEPGKIIHEYRPNGHEHLTQAISEPWYLYPDQVMRSFDSVDSTPLFLMTVHRYFQLSGDQECVDTLLPNIKLAIDWLMMHSDTNGDGFIDYHFDPKRTFGGLRSQSWMDSTESVFFENYDEQPRYPIAPVEAQAYAYAALRSWSDYFTASEPALAKELGARADTLKIKFNDAFVLHGRKTSLAFAIDGRSRPLTSARSSMGHVLWACTKDNISSVFKPDCILDEKYIPAIVTRLLQPDLYVRNAGIRTLNSRSKKYDPQSYHNGSIWPHDTTIIAQGLENFGYKEDAQRVRHSILKAYEHFETPIELFVYANRKFGEYLGPAGQKACRQQAWSAAALLTMLGAEESFDEARDK